MSVQFSSVQSMRSGWPICPPPPSLRSFPQCCLWNSSNVGLLDDGPFSSSMRNVRNCEKPKKDFDKSLWSDHLCFALMSITGLVDWALKQQTAGDIDLKSACEEDTNKTKRARVKGVHKLNKLPQDRLQILAPRSQTTLTAEWEVCTRTAWPRTAHGTHKTTWHF